MVHRLVVEMAKERDGKKFRRMIIEMTMGRDRKKFGGMGKGNDRYIFLEIMISDILILEKNYIYYDFIYLFFI